MKVVLEAVAPDPNHRPSLVGPQVQLGAPKTAMSSCREEVLAAVAILCRHSGDRVCTVREGYAERVEGGTEYPEVTVFKTMQRMLEPPTQSAAMGFA
jgi:hypothetical protein